MINIVSTSDKLQLVTSSTATLDCHVSYLDFDTDTPTIAVPGRKNTAINTAATTDLMAATADSTVFRKVKIVTVRNKHATISGVLIFKHTDGTTAVELFRCELMPGEAVEFLEHVGWRVFTAGGAPKPDAVLDPSTNEFRLTGVTGQPIMLADSTTLSNLYLARFRGANICLYNGTTWNKYSPVEPTIAVTGRTTDLPFDVFAYADAAGAVQLEMLNWASATARATALVRQDGVWVKTGDATRRWVGSVRARSATTFHWVLQGNDLPVKMDLFNADNREEMSFSLRALTNTWAYTLATWRQAQASANYQVDIMVGEEGEFFEADLKVSSRNSTISIPRQVGIGFDITTGISGASWGAIVSATANTVASIEADQNAGIRHRPTIGRHFFAWLEISTATGTCTWIGDDGAARLQSGMVGNWKC